MPTMVPSDLPDSIRDAMASGAPIRKSTDVRWIVAATFEDPHGPIPDWLSDVVALCDADVAGVAMLRHFNDAWGKKSRMFVDLLVRTPKLPKTGQAARRFWSRKSNRRHAFLDFGQGLPDAMLARLSQDGETTEFLAHTLTVDWRELVDTPSSLLADKVRMTARWLGLGGTDLAVVTLCSLLRSTRDAFIDHPDVYICAGRDGIVRGLAQVEREASAMTLACECLARSTDSAFDVMNSGSRSPLTTLRKLGSAPEVIDWVVANGWDLQQHGCGLPVESDERLWYANHVVRHQAFRDLAERTDRSLYTSSRSPQASANLLKLALAERLDYELQSRRRPDELDLRSRHVAMREFWLSLPRPPGVPEFDLADYGTYGPRSGFQKMLGRIVSDAAEASWATVPSTLVRVHEEGADAVAVDLLSRLPAPPDATPFLVAEDRALHRLDVGTSITVA